MCHLPKQQILDSSELKEFSGKSFKFDEHNRKFFKLVEKKLWEKETLLVRSNFSFSHSVFKGLVLQKRKNQGLFGKGFNPFPNKPWFLRVCSSYLLKTLEEKEKLLITSNFSYSLSIFYPLR